MDTLYFLDEDRAAIIKLWQGVLSALTVSLLGSLLFQKLAGWFQDQAEKRFYVLNNEKSHS